MASETRKKVGRIDLAALFESLVIEIEAAAQKGQVLHATLNIRDSGGPVEHVLRQLFASRVPDPFSIARGYLFDAKSICTPEADLLIFDNTNSHELTKSADGASYIPFHSVRAVGEFKSSTSRVATSLIQISRFLRALRDMNNRSVAMTLAGANIANPLSFIVFVTSVGASIRALQRYFSAKVDKPDYVLLLDRAVLITGYEPALSPYLKDDPAEKTRLSIKKKKTSYKPIIWQPAEGAHRRGRLLLWFFYAILYRLEQDRRSKEKEFPDFFDEIDKVFPLFEYSHVSNAVDLPSIERGVRSSS